MKNKIKKLTTILFSLLMTAIFVLELPCSVYAATAKSPKVYSNGKVSFTYVYFGSYPQKEVVYKGDQAQISALQARNISSGDYELVSQAKWNKIVNAKYNKNGDATINGVKYRRIKMSDATQAQSDTPELYKWNDSVSYHYFKYEAIKWRVLYISNGKATLISEYALDDEKYNETDSAALMWNINWKNSTIRSWLNGYSSSINARKINFSSNNFIDTAFSSSQQKKLGTKTGATGTKDKVFLLDETDINNTTRARRNGFVNSTHRQCKCTTYAYAKGIWRPRQGSDTTVMWWLNTDDAGDMAPNVTYDGDVDSDGRNNNKDAIGVRPSIIVSTKTLKTLKVTTK